MAPLTQKSISLIKGPAGRVIAEPMEAELIDAFYHHTSLERAASAQYFAMSLWFVERELRGFGEYFNKESLSEQDHALHFAKYLISRGQTVKLDDIPSPIQDWSCIDDLISFSFQMEADVTTSIQQIYSMSERSGDTRNTVFLDPIIEEQVKTEDYIAYLLGKVNFAKGDPSALLLIDNELK